MKIEIENLTFSYGGRKVLNGVDMVAQPSQVTCVVGPNGSGKSTLVKCVEALLPPSGGAVLLGGRDPRKMTRSAIARCVGYVPQRFQLAFPMTVFDLVLMGRRPHVAWKSSARDMGIVIDTLVQMGLEEIAMRAFQRLSGGQQQRVMVARALAQQPECLLLDEPTSALDIAHQLDLMDTVSLHAREKGLSVLMVVHDLNLAARYADSIVMMKDGQVVVQGDPEGVLTPENLSAVYGVKALIGSQQGRVTVVPLAKECASGPRSLGLTNAMP
ncbi:ABC transporter ATP-binding protein [Desulfoluna spongiiphila]|uniref:ABC transporter ATP-binding protein n=1 Tax=Desulfoluna spongiiphila TaxID=419481 RepID=UPI001253EC0C|nr:ABC transporter ATP-binding protein [Desulfoluna spongiiphila]VVS94544.1 abc transporter-like [Desulfoluna spongiiphila]